METNQSTITKSQLAETIISILSLNKLGYKFFKSNYRYYYFKRETPNDEIADMIVICVYFRRGEISCWLHTKVDGIINKYKYSTQNNGQERKICLFNSKLPSNIDKSGFPVCPDAWHFYFTNSIDSLKLTLNLLLSDINLQGREFLKICHKSYSNRKFLCGMKIIKKLTLNKAVLKEELKSQIKHYYNDIILPYSEFHELVEQLNNIKEDYEIKYNIHNHWSLKGFSNRYIAFQFFWYYCHDNND